MVNRESIALMDLVFPVVAVVFIALYVTSISAGTEPEVALLRAGIAGIALAALGRASQWILTNAESTAVAAANAAPAHLDFVLDEDLEQVAILGNGQVQPGGKE
jgi:hypothetical protein